MNARRPAALVLALAAAPAVAAAQMEFKLPPTDLAQGDGLGDSIAISGGRVLAGVSGDDDLGAQSGSARVFEKQSGVWVQTAKIVASDAFPADYFGTSVDLDGTRAAIGAWREGDTGAVYVFELTGGAWVEQAKLKASDGQLLDSFGNVLELDGDRLLIGASRADDFGTDSGAAYVFDRVGGAWVESAKLLASDGEAGDAFGYSVALSGNRALVGAFLEDTQGYAAGSAYVYELQGTAWVETQKLMASDGSGSSYWAYSVALEGDRAAVGAIFYDGPDLETGAAYVFDHDGTSWVESAILVPDDVIKYDRIGDAVALQGDRLLIGGSDKFTGTSRTGAVYVYDLVGGAWTQTDFLVPSDAGPGDSDDFGDDVAISGDEVAVGVRFGNQLGFFSTGAGYVYDLSCQGTGLATYCTGKVNSESCLPWITCAGGPASAAGTFTIVGNDVLNNKPGLLFYGTTGRASLPWQGGTLCVQPALQRTLPQASGGNPPPNDCSGTYTFDFSALVASGSDPALVPGVTVNAQYWYRDPQDPQGVGLTNALELELE